MHFQSLTDNRRYFAGYRSIVHDRINSVVAGQNFARDESVVHRSLASLTTGKEDVALTLFSDASVALVRAVHEEVMPQPTPAACASDEVFYRNIFVFV